MFKLSGYMLPFVSGFYNKNFIMKLISKKNEFLFYLINLLNKVNLKIKSY